MIWSTLRNCFFFFTLLNTQKNQKPYQKTKISINIFKNRKKKNQFYNRYTLIQQMMMNDLNLKKFCEPHLYDMMIKISNKYTFYLFYFYLKKKKETYSRNYYIENRTVK